MPAYGATPDEGITLAPGQSIQLVNAADATAGTLTQTIGVAIGPTAGFTPTLTLINTTNQTATIACAASDSAAANYEPLTNADANNAITCPAGKSITFSCAAPFVCATFASAPTTGLLTLCR